MSTIAVYPGSFDPITNGHLDIIRRAAAVFDASSSACWPTRARRRCCPSRRASGSSATPSTEAGGSLADRIEVASFDGLTVDFCRARGAGSIVRGLRAISDFEVEMQLAHNNRVLAPDVDTVFFMTSVENGYVSSSLVKEIAGFGGDVVVDGPGAAARTALRRGTPEALTRTVRVP